MRVLIVDNYDSFTHLLAQVLGGLGADCEVRRHDRPLAELLSLRPDRVVLSPGPGRPGEAGVSLAALRAFSFQAPILGVCLGHQVIAEAFGGRIRRGPPVHGRSSPLLHDGSGLFAGLPQSSPAGRYHSLVVEPGSLPPALAVNAWTGEGTVMGLRHVSLPITGLQFHPESILTELGPALLARFLERGR